MKPPFKKHETSSAELERYREAVEELVNAGIMPFVLFGGYFAILLGYFGLQGCSNGIGYGEWRDSGYHRGSTAANRIYILKLHRYLDPPHAQNLLAACVNARRSLTDLTPAECHDHFIECRQSEIEFVSSQSVGDAIAELQETVDRLASVGELESAEYGSSLGRWGGSNTVGARMTDASASSPIRTAAYMATADLCRSSSLSIAARMCSPFNV